MPGPLVSPPIDELQDALRSGLATVTELWSYKAKNWVTSIHATDIDMDGDVEIIAGSRDGRVCALTRHGDTRWERVVGSKAWVGSVVCLPPQQASESPARVLAGTRDGRVYALDKDGKTITPDGTRYSFDRAGYPLDKDEELATPWHVSAQVIRQVALDASGRMMVIGSEDRRVYARDTLSGEELWSFATKGWVRAVCCCDLNGDGQPEVLVGSGDKHLYVLDHCGQPLVQRNIGRKVYTICAADVDQDGQVEILLGTDRKELLALTPMLEAKWFQYCENRVLALAVVDLDGDGRNEIIVGCEDRHLYVLDEHGSALWRHYLGQRIFCVYALDIDKDGQIEVLAGSDAARVHAFRIRLQRGLGKRIRRCYQDLGRPALESLSLSAAERSLLEAWLPDDVRGLRPPARLSHLAHPGTSQLAPHQTNLKHVEQLMKAQQYRSALGWLLRLAQQKVQLLWSKDKVGHVRTLYFGDITGDPRREIILGTSEGVLQTFSSAGRSLWSHPIGTGDILTLQAGYIDRGKWQEILACSSDHHIYVINGARKQIKRHVFIDEWMSTLYISASERNRPARIIAGFEDKKIQIYGSNLQTPRQTIATPQGIKIVCAYEAGSGGDQAPDIIAGSIERSVYAYTRSGKLLWEYPTIDRVRSLTIKDIDEDGRAEILVGSEDLNVHVLDSNGHLKWRYFMPNRILSVEAFDIDQDGHIEILAGCGDGILYVLNAQGDLLWTYHANDRIRVVKAEDIDDDGNVEIAIGSEEGLELLQVLNQHTIEKMIQSCWQAIASGMDKSAGEVTGKLMGEATDRVTDEGTGELAPASTLLQDSDAYIRAFAVQLLSEQGELGALEQFEPLVADSSVEVRRSLTCAAMRLYNSDAPRARRILNAMLTDQEQDIRLTFIDNIHLLMENDWQVGFEYLDGFARNIDRFVRRAVVRNLSRLIGALPHEDARNLILDLLLNIIEHEESQWIRSHWLQQEAARTLAYFLDTYSERLFPSLRRLLIPGQFGVPAMKPEILRDISYHVKVPVVQRILNALVPLVFEMDEQNVLERVEQAVRALEEAKTLKYGLDTWIEYREFQRLLALRSIEEIAGYVSSLSPEQFLPTNNQIPPVLRLLGRCSSISRILKIYLQRRSSNDRLTCLLDALQALDMLQKAVKREYSPPSNTNHTGQSTRTPDLLIIEILLKRWRTLLEAQMMALRGRAELAPELLTQRVPREEAVGVWLVVRNSGNNIARNVHVTLLHSSEFDITGPHSKETEMLVSHDEWKAEFVIKPCAPSSTAVDAGNVLNLVFELSYDDAEQDVQMQVFETQLTFETPRRAFRSIPNPYSTGTPTRDSEMFYGREEDIEFLRDNLTRAEARSVIVLYGQRRSGKTTLLMHLTHTPALGEHIPVLIDMQRESYKITVSKFLYKVAYYIAQTLAKRDIPHLAALKPQQKEYTADPTFTFDLFLDEVEAHLEGRRVVLLLDEFEVLEEQVKKKNLEPEIFEYLRSVMQHRQSINFLLSGTHKIEQLTRGYWSVFFNMARHYHLTHLSPSGAEGLIKRPVRGYLEYEPNAVTKIRQLTGDQPYLVHLVCRALIDYCNGLHKAYVSINDVNTVQREVMQTGQFHFDWLWEQIGAAERVVLALMVEGGKDDGRPLTLLEMETIAHDYHLSCSADCLLEALTTLIEADVVEAVIDELQEGEPTRYRIPVGLIRRWLLTEKPLETVVKEFA